VAVGFACIRATIHQKAHAIVPPVGFSMRPLKAKAWHMLWQPNQNNSFVPSLSLCSASAKGQAQGTKPTLIYK